MDEIQKKIELNIRQDVLLDIQLKMWKKKEEGILLDFNETLEIINNLHEQYRQEIK